METTLGMSTGVGAKRGRPSLGAAPEDVLTDLSRLAIGALNPSRSRVSSVCKYNSTILVKNPYLFDLLTAIAMVGFHLILSLAGIKVRRGPPWSGKGGS
jgi:hypothetical protein